MAADDDLFGGSGDVISSAGDMETDDSDMVWQRHDNSVLFSLGESEGPKKAAPKEKKKAKALAALTADSGLIDIRSFAKKKQATNPPSDLFAGLAGDNGGIALGRGSGNALLDAGAGPAATAAPVPILHRRRKKKTGFGFVLAAILGAGAVAGLTAFLVLKYFNPPVAPAPNAPQTKQVAQATPQADQPAPVHSEPVVGQPAAPKAGQPAAIPGGQPGAVSAAGVAGQPATPPNAAVQPVVAVQAGAQPAVAGQPVVAGQPSAQPTVAGQPVVAGQPGAQAAVAGQPGAQPVEPAQPAKVKKPAVPLTSAQKKALKEKRDKAKKAREESKAARAAAKKAQAAAAAKKAADAKKANNRAVDPNALLKTLGTPTPKKKDPVVAATTNEDLPTKLTATQVKKVMRRASSKVRNCVSGAGESNVRVNASFTVQPSGSVSGVSISGTSAKGCVSGVISRLRFPKVKGKARPISYPYVVK